MHLLKNAREEMQATKEQINPLILYNERMHQTKNCWEWWNYVNTHLSNLEEIFPGNEFLFNKV